MQSRLDRSGASLLLLALVACAKAGALPLAVLGADQSVATGSVVTVDGAGSHDPQAAPVTFEWSFVSMPAGSHAAFRLADKPKPLFTADVSGKYTVRLVVRTTDYASDPAFTTITATECGSHVPTVGTPVATPNNAGVGVSVKLTAPEATDLDNAAACNLHQVLAYTWSITSQPAGSRARLNDAHALAPLFTPDVAGSYRVQLVIKDSTGLSSDPATGSIPVTVLGCGSNTPRIDSVTSSPGAPGLGIATQLSAAVTDDDNNPLTCNLHRTLHYAWSLVSLPTGSTATLNAGTLQNPTFTPDFSGVYVARLVVSDEFGHSSPSQDLPVTATACGEVPVPSLSFLPVAAGIGTTVQLKATTPLVLGSCPLSTVASYAWTILSEPTSSTATLNGSTLQNPSFTPDQPGTYSIGLVLTDAAGFQSPQRTIDIVVAGCGKNPPVINSLTSSVSSPAIGQPLLITPDVFDPDQSCAGFLPARSYAWSVVTKPDASKAFFQTPVAVATTFTDPARIGSLTLDAPGDYQVQLVVTDATGLSSAPFLLHLLAGPCGFLPPAILSALASTASPILGQPVTLSAAVQNANNLPACGLSHGAALSWRITSRPAGSAAVLTNPAADKPVVVPDLPGNYQFSVVATDLANGLVSPPAWVGFATSSCGTHAPGVSVTPAQAGTTPGSGLALTAVPSDPDAGCGVVKTFTYRWQIVAAPTGSAAGFDNPTGAAPVFTPDLPGSYSLSVIATDQNGLVSAPAFASVTASACSTLGPAVDLINATAAPLGGTVTVSANRVTDRHCPVQTSFMYHWRLATRPPGSQAVMASPLTTGGSSFIPDVAGTYQVGLIVSDAAGLQSPEAFQVVTIAPCGGSTFSWGPAATQPILAHYYEPSASTPSGTSAPSGSLLNVGGSAILQANFSEVNSACSSAPLGPYSYAWSLIARPFGSKAQLNSTTNAMPGFVADVAGTYQMTVRISDALGNSSAAPAPLSITTSPCGTAVPLVHITNGPATFPTNAAQALHLAAGFPTDADDGCPVRFQVNGAYTYQWRIASSSIGGQAVIQNATLPDASFIASAPGTYGVQLVATASSGLSGSSAPVAFTATRCGSDPPVVYGVALADGSGPVTSPKAGSPLTLTASAQSPDQICGVSVSAYTWTLLSAPPGSGVTAPGTKTGAGANTFGFTPDVAGTYRFTVAATDSNSFSSIPFPIAISTAACKPTFTASGPTTAKVGALVSVSTGTPADLCVKDNAFAYAWTVLARPLGSAAVLQNATAATASLTADLVGTYQIQAVVTDSAGNASDPQVLRIDAGSCGSLPPLVSLVSSLPATPDAGQAVQLSVSAASQNSGCATPQATAFSYSWSVLSAPAGSKAALGSSTSASPSFVPDLPGTYQLSVIVTDGFGNRADPAFFTLKTSLCGVNVPTVTIAASGSTSALNASTPLTLTATPADADNTSCPSRFQVGFQFAWSIVSTPAGGSATLTSSSGASTTFQAAATGAYKVAVVATASSGLASLPGTQQITVSACGATAPAVLAVSQKVGGTPVSQPKVNDTVQLDASAVDAGCGSVSLTYAWSVVGTPAGSAFTPSTSANTLTFQPNLPGSYLFGVVATDSAFVSSAPFQVTVAVGGSCGLSFSAGASPSTVQVGGSVGLTAGAVTDNCVPAGSTASALGYRWSVAARPPGSSALVTNPAAASNTFTPDAPGDYTLQLVITDGAGFSGVAAASLHAGPCSQAPSVSSIAATATEPNGSTPLPTLLANTAYAGDRVSLSAVVGPSGCGVAPAGVTWRWSLASTPAGSAAQMANSASATPSFVADLAGASYQVMLIVTDALGNPSAPSFTTLSTTTCGKTPPVVSFAPFTNPLRFNPVALSVSASDTDTSATSCPVRLQPASTFTFNWSVAGKPAGASPSLAVAPGGGSATFTGDLAGGYQVQVIAVASNGAASAPATAPIAVASCVAGPVYGTPVVSQTVPAGTSTTSLHTNLPTQLSLASLHDSTADLGGCGVAVASGTIAVRWTLSGAPAGSRTVLTGANTATPSLIPDKPGTYTFQILATDALGSSTSSFSITTDTCGTAAPTSQSFTATQTLPAGGPIVSPATTGAPSFLGSQKLDVGFPLTVQTIAADADQATCGLVTPFSYAWTLQAPPLSRAALVGPGSATPGLVPDVVGNYLLTLVLTDSTGPSSTQTFTLPVTCAATGALAVDNGAAHLAAFSATQVLPLVNLQSGGGTTNFTIVHSTLPDTDTTANKNLNVPFYLGMPVQLAANVHDAGAENTAACPGGYPETIAYQWALVGQPPGSIARLNNPAATAPGFYPDVAGEYDVQLTLSDSAGHVNTQVFRTATATTVPSPRPVVGAGFCGTQAPQANIGLLRPVVVAPGTGNVFVGTGSLVQLDASGTVDHDNDPLNLSPSTATGCGLNHPVNYVWQLISMPSGAGATLSAATISNPTFAASLTGQYRVRLTASAGSRSGSADRIVQATAADQSQSSIAANPISQTVGQNVSITVAVKDFGGNPIAGLPATVSSSGTGNTFTPASRTGISDANGLVVVTMTSTKAETKSVTAVIAGTTPEGPIAPPVTFTPDAATQMVITTNLPGPSGPNYASAAPLPDPLVISAEDQFGNVDTNYTTAVTLALPGTLPAGCTAVLAVAPAPATIAGVATFSNDITITTAKTTCNGLTLTASSVGTPVTTNAFNVAPSTTPLSPPSNLVAAASVTAVSSTGNNLITLTWSLSTDKTLDHYDIYRSTTGTPALTAGNLIAQPLPNALLCGTGKGQTNTCTYQDSPLSDGTTYYYAVTAANAIDTQSPAITANATTAPPVPPDFAGEPVYSSINAGVQLTWTAAPGVTYTLNRSSGIAVGSVSPGFTDSNLSFGQTYTYSLTAGTGAIIHTTSPALSFTLRPAVPGGLGATAKDFSEIDVSWSATTSATSYAVSRGPASTGPFTLLGSVTAPKVLLADFAVVPATQYFYVVSATNSAASSPCLVSPLGNGTCTSSPNSGSQPATTPAAPSWTGTNSGLFGGSVRSFAQDQTTLIAGTGGLGVYASTNDAQSWVSQNDASGIATATVLSLATETFTTPHVLFAGTNGGGTFKTNLPFAPAPAWTAANGTTAALPNLVINVLGVDQVGNVYAGTQAGLFKTLAADLGATTWTQIAAATLPGSITALFVVSDQIFYVGSGTRIYATTNGGGLMTSQNDFGAGAQVNGIAVNGSNEYAATGAGVFMSGDGGSTWGVSSGTGSTNEISLAFDRANPNVLYVGEDTGGVFSASVPPAPGNNIAFTSRTGGLPCTGLTTACPASPAKGSIFALAIKGGSSSNTLYAGTGNGSVFRTSSITSLGSTPWTSSSPGIPSVFVNGIASAKDTAGPIQIAITNENVFEFASGATSWKLVLVPPTTRINAVAANSSTGRVYVGVNWTGSKDVYTANYTLGTNWDSFAAISGADATALVNDAGIGPTTYVGTNGQFITSCVGTSAPTCTAYTTTTLNQNIHALALDANLKAYAGTDTPTGAGAGLSSFIQLSGGTWAADTTAGFPTAPIRSLAPAQISGSTVIFAGTDTNVQRRTTSSWTALTGLTLTSGSSAQALLIDPLRTTTVMVGTTKDGVQRSPDSGTTWYPFNGSLTNLNVTALAFSGTVIYGGTSGSGIFTNPNR